MAALSWSSLPHLLCHGHDMFNHPGHHSLSGHATLAVQICSPRNSRHLLLSTISSTCAQSCKQSMSCDVLNLLTQDATKTHVQMSHGSNLQHHLIGREPAMAMLDVHAPSMMRNAAMCHPQRWGSSRRSQQGEGHWSSGRRAGTKRREKLARGRRP